jgi:transmembrane sensor
MSATEEQMREAVALQAAEWFVAHRSGELGEAGREAFIDWLRASPVHAREYLALTGFAEDLGQAAQRFTAPADELIGRASEESSTVRPLFRAARTAGASRRPPALFAAVAAAIVMASVAALWWLRDRADYTTQHAEQRSWRLEDGSTVHLNSDSQIEVRFDHERREVALLKGQAIFRVTQDAARPFWVTAGNVKVKVLGTEFDVYRQAQGAVVSVLEGRVAVWNAPEAAPAAQLDAGQQVRVTNRAAVVSNKSDDVRKTMAWLQRQVVFDHDELGSAVEEFNRYNDLQIQVNDAALAKSQVSGIFSAYDADSFIRFLERQPGMRVERSGGDVVVHAVH